MHSECLREWLHEGAADSCPQCKHAYALDVSYASIIHRALDHSCVPQYASLVALVVLFVGFHALFQRALVKLRGGVRGGVGGSSKPRLPMAMMMNSQFTTWMAELELFAITLLLSFLLLQWACPDGSFCRRTQQTWNEAQSSRSMSAGDSMLLNPCDVLVVAQKALCAEFGALQKKTICKQTVIHAYASEDI